MRTLAVAASFRREILLRAVWRTLAMALVLPSVLAVGASGEDVVAKIAVSASPAASYFGDLVEGVMEFRGNKYLLRLHGVSVSTSSKGLVFGLRRARDIVGPYTSTADGVRNASGVTIRFDPSLEIRGALRIELSARIYPKGPTAQGGNVE